MVVPQVEIERLNYLTWSNSHSIMGNFHETITHPLRKVTNHKIPTKKVIEPTSTNLIPLVYLS